MTTTWDTGSRMIRGMDAVREVRGAWPGESTQNSKHDQKLENSATGVPTFFLLRSRIGVSLPALAAENFREISIFVLCAFLLFAIKSIPLLQVLSRLFVLTTRGQIPHAAASHSYQKASVRTSSARVCRCGHSHHGSQCMIFWILDFDAVGEFYSLLVRYLGASSPGIQQHTPNSGCVTGLPV